jgi:quinol monooxygenase YgiN
MITVLFQVTVLPEREAEFRSMVREMTESSRADDGCIDYIFYSRIGQPGEFVLYERWRDQESLNAHVARLRVEYGPADDDPSLPETHFRRRLPRSFMDLFSSAEAARYEAVLAKDAVS